MKYTDEQSAKMIDHPFLHPTMTDEDWVLVLESKQQQP
jgi:hypothetical protein